MESETAQPEWDQTLANSFNGAVVLVGITYDDPGGQRAEQFFGTVIAVDSRVGITLQLGGSRSGEIFMLPPDLHNMFPATPGSYRLRQSGDVVEDPDYTTTWVLAAPPD